MNSLDPRPDAPAPARSDSPLDLIFIEGLRGETVIGIYTSEMHEPQPVVIDLYAGVARARACDTDRIADTIDYAVVRERLHRLLREHGVRTLEAFAERVAAILLDEFGAAWVRVRVVKPRKCDDLQAVGVQIERSAAPPSDGARGQRGAAVLHLIGSGMVPPRN